MHKEVTTWHTRRVVTLIFSHDELTELSIPDIIEDELIARCKASDALIAELHRVINFMNKRTLVMAVLQTVPVKILKSTNHFTKWQIIFFSK